jgi:hypothetical protein
MQAYKYLSERDTFKIIQNKTKNNHLQNIKKKKSKIVISQSRIVKITNVSHDLNISVLNKNNGLRAR